MAHVLAVSDDKVFTRAMLRLLPYGGHSVTVAESDDEALAVLRSSLHPLVVLLDATMTETGGYSVERILAAADEAGTAWERHAYFILTFLSLARSPRMDELITALRVTVILHPLNFDALSEAITQAASAAAEAG